MMAQMNIIMHESKTLVHAEKKIKYEEGKLI
jgi:hypothetical protein